MSLLIGLGPAAAVAPVGPVTKDRVLPSVDDVALLLRTRTVGAPSGQGLGGDTGPADVTSFNAETRPTSVEVSRVIQTAYGAIMPQILGQLVNLTDDQADGVKHAIAMYATQLISLSFFPETSEKELAFWRTELKTLIVGLNYAINAGATRPRFGSVRVGAHRDPPAPDYAVDLIPGIDFPIYWFDRPYGIGPPAGAPGTVPR